MTPAVDPASVWTLAHRSLETLAANPDATPADLRRWGTTLWAELSGEDFEPPLPGEPFPWAKLDAAGITPGLGALPVALARTLLADSAQTMPSAAALLETLNMLASLQPAVPVCADMPSRVPGSDPDLTLEPRPPVPADTELWTRGPARLAASNRRRREGSDVLNTLVLLAAGGLGGFFGGMLYEKTHGLSAAAVSSTAQATPVPAMATPASAPDVPLPPSPLVGAAAVTARVQIVKTRQPDVGEILKYAREFRRLGTLRVTDPAAFPSENQFAQLTERFFWKEPNSPDAHRTPLLVLLGYANDPAVSRKGADQLAQVLTQSGITSPMYTCGMGPGQTTPEVEKAGIGTDGRFVEVWAAFTLF